VTVRGVFPWLMPLNAATPFKTGMGIVPMPPTSKNGVVPVPNPFPPKLANTA
jgi:hypothetical protein